MNQPTGTNTNWAVFHACFRPLVVMTCFLFLLTPTAFSASIPNELRVGIANHAFDHLGNIGEQAEAAAASGANIIYVTSLGTLGYQGLPAKEELSNQRRAAAAYLRGAKAHGIRLALGYVCATSIVKLDAFDKNWSPQLRSRFRTPPAEWRQQDRNGKPLPSWYGGDYQPACMNNPDWREYERFIVRQQLESGCDGIFFDNPTVHPQGCYCPHCMEKFARFVQRADLPSSNSLVALREFAVAHSADFLRFRCTIARDFLAEIRRYARTIKSSALITANNSLNSTDVLYSQCRSHGYNIYEMSQAEDFVVVEDQSSQPRVLANGQMIEYGPTYKQLHAISHGKPVVAVTIAEADYHTPPNLVRLAMAEAAANDASYLSWPTWPESERHKMISVIRPQADLLRLNEKLLNDTRARRDAVLFLPFRRWTETGKCVASTLAAALTRANVQYEVICEDDLETVVEARLPARKFSFGTPKGLRATKVLVVESMSVFNADEKKLVEKFQRAGGRIVAADQVNWLKEVQQTIAKPSLVLQGPSTLRAVVRDQPRCTIVHLLNLNIERLSSFTDKTSPASDIRLIVRVPFDRVRSIRALTADAGATHDSLKFSTHRDRNQTVAETTVPRVEIATLLVIEP